MDKPSLPTTNGKFHPEPVHSPLLPFWSSSAQTCTQAEGKREHLCSLGGLSWESTAGGRAGMCHQAESTLTLGHGAGET